MTKRIPLDTKQFNVRLPKPKHDPLDTIIPSQPPIAAIEEKEKPKNSTQKVTRSREKSRGLSRSLPTRDEIQMFSFQMRDEFKVKVQAEVPHNWGKELEELAIKLDVKKLELYRFIIGEFLGKVQRKK